MFLYNECNLEGRCMHPSGLLGLGKLWALLSKEQRHGAKERILSRAVRTAGREIRRMGAVYGVEKGAQQSSNS